MMPLRSTAASMGLAGVLLCGGAYADEGDAILRFGAGLAKMHGRAASTGSSSSPVNDPQLPPGIFEGLEVLAVEPDDAVTLEAELEVLLTDRIGVAFGLARTYVDFDLTYSGTITYTRTVGDPPTLDPSTTETASIQGLQRGHFSMMPLSVALRYHALQTPKLDLYAGPVAAYVLYEHARIGDGGFTARFAEFTSVSPRGAAILDLEDDFAWGATIGVDVALGRRGWILWATTRYLSAEVAPRGRGLEDAAPLHLDPWAVRVGLGHRF